MTARKIDSQRAKKATRSAYQKIAKIDGGHPLQEAAPGSYVTYRARKRKRAKVCYFNFDLAREMGLIPQNHTNGLNEELSNVLIDTFGIIIINEYDFIHNKKFDETDLKENMYMATRYLQMQHKSRTGLTSGDGRGIWNGFVSNKKKMWDITSNGTGATCLSPAAANNQKFYQSGDPSIAYGCGYAELQDAIGNSVFSEILHQNGTPTERTLCIIEYPGSFCVAVRAGENLLRPSHFFNHLKQGHYQRLKNTFDFFIERELGNQSLALKKLPMKKRYDAVLMHLSGTYAKMCAQFERDYIFCWLDWDGDNMLANGGIIDYGSIRQMGLCHHQYRFDDDERWSTNLLEQRQKGRYILQTFCQLVDFLKTGIKKNRDKFKNHKALNEYDKTFTNEKKRLLLKNMGFDDLHSNFLMSKNLKLVSNFEKHFEVFERMGSKKGEVNVPDGVARFAVFNMRELLKEIPQHFMTSEDPMEHQAFMNVMKSKYATKKDLKLTNSRLSHVNLFQKSYSSLIEKVAKEFRKDKKTIFKRLAHNSSIINRSDRVTGDGMFYVGEALYKIRKKLSADEWSQLIRDFISSQNVSVEKGLEAGVDILETAKSSKKHLMKLLDIISTYREGL